MKNILDLFKHVDSISAEEVRKYVKGRSPDQYCLLDVRQPSEYEGGHLPGAVLMPLGDVQARLKEMDPEKQTIVYCRSGSRSRSAAGLLLGAGFKNVLNMEGGILAYHGITASGGPESGMFCFPESLSPGEMAAVAWFLEEGTLAFLKGVREDVGEAQAVFNELTSLRNSHKASLLGLYRDLTGQEAAGDFPRGVIPLPDEQIMVGCIKVSSALNWAKGKTASDILELMISLEANALDLYLRLGRTVKSEEARKVFKVLSEEKKRGIDLLTPAFEKTLQG